METPETEPPEQETHMTRKHRTYVSTLATLACAGALMLTACGKKGGSEKKAADEADKGNTPAAMGAIMAARNEPRPRPKAIEWVTVSLPKTKLKIKVPKGTKISDSILANTDAVKLPGGRHSFVVRKWQHGDKPLKKVIGWAKGHQLQKHKGDVLKKGAGKIYTYIYKVNMGGRPGAVFHQYKDVGGQVFRCYANAKSAASAQLFHRCCNSLSK
jgi:hypothetical protein